MARPMEFEDAEEFFKEPSTSTTKPVGRRTRAAAKPKATTTKKATAKKPAIKRPARTAADKKVDAKTPVRTVAPAKTGVAKKKAELASKLKLRADKGDTATTIKTTPIKKPKIEGEAPKKRGPGRPRKTETVTVKEPKMAETKKRPGRPKKATVKKHEEEKPVAKKRGRPKKTEVKHEEHKAPAKKRGRPAGSKNKAKIHAEESKGAKKEDRKRAHKKAVHKADEHREETKVRKTRVKSAARKAASTEAKKKARLTKDGKVDMRGKHVRTAEHRAKLSKSLKKAWRTGRHKGNTKHGLTSKKAKLESKKRSPGRPKKAKGKGHYKRTAKHGHAIAYGRAESKAVHEGRAFSDIRSRRRVTKDNYAELKADRKRKTPKIKARNPSGTRRRKAA